MTDGSPLTSWKPPGNEPGKGTVEPRFVLSPATAHHGHTHGPETPAKEGHEPQLALGEVAAPAQHARAYCQGLDHIEVRPRPVIGDDNGRFAGGQLIAGTDNPGAIDSLEDELKPRPHRAGQARREVVDELGSKRLEW